MRARPAAPWLAVASAGALLAAAPPGAAGQEADTVPPPRPLVPGGVYDKPYLATLLGRTALGGYAEAHARLERVDGATEEAGFEARRFNLFTATRVSDFVRIGAELEIEEGGEEVTLEYAAIDVILHPSAALRAGMILLPLGRFNLAHDSPRNEFTDRPAVSTDVLGVALSQPGVGVFGSLGLGGEARLTWEAYAVNGYGSGVVEGSGDGVRLPEGASNAEDENGSPAWVARLAFSPAEALEVGLSGYRGAYNVFRIESVDVDEPRDVTVGVLDLHGELWGFRVEGEGALVSVELPPGLEGFLGGRQRGFYLEAMRDFGRGWVTTMPASRFSAGVRVDAVDFDSDGVGDSTAQVTLGLNFRPTSDTVLKLNWVRGRGFDTFSNRADHAALLFSVATYF